MFVLLSIGFEVIFPLSNWGSPGIDFFDDVCYNYFERDGKDDHHMTRFS